MTQHKFQKRDYVSWENNNNTEYGYIEKISDNHAKIRIKDRWNDGPTTLPLRKKQNPK